MQPPSGSAPITLTAARHKSTGNTSYQVESDFSQARMLASWGSSDYTIAASGDKYLITAGGKVYTFVPGSVGIGVPLPTVVAEYEVLPDQTSPRPSATIGENLYVAMFANELPLVETTWGSTAVSDYGILIYHPANSEQEYIDPTFVLYIDWFGAILDPPGGGQSVVVSTMPGASYDVTNSNVWSFGNLMSYPGVPIIG